MIPELASQIIRRQADKQQAHIFRQIAIKYSQEVDELAQAYDRLYETVEQDRATYQDTIDKLEQKQNRDTERLKKL